MLPNMQFYLEENRYNIILFATDDPFLINNVASGIIDCRVRYANKDNYDKIINHPKYQDLTHGIYIKDGYQVDGRVDTLYIATDESVKRKIELIKLRVPAFEKLLSFYNQMMIPNLYGFNEFDPFVINHFLKDPIAIAESAALLQQDPEFLATELALIAESVIDDRFRMFTVATMWKNKINKCFTQTDIDRLTVPMMNSFKQTGVRIDV